MYRNGRREHCRIEFNELSRLGSSVWQANCFMGIESIFPSWAVLMTFQLAFQEQDKTGHRRILPNTITQATENPVAGISTNGRDKTEDPVAVHPDAVRNAIEAEKFKSTAPLQGR